MDRRQFLRNATLVAAGVVAADQLELLDRLGWVRRLFSGWSEPISGRARLVAMEQSAYCVTQAEWDALLSSVYVKDAIVGAVQSTTEFSLLTRPRPLHFAPGVYKLPCTLLVDAPTIGGVTT